MTTEEIGRKRCDDCGAIMWTSPANGCTQCSSHAIEEFAELEGYLSPPKAALHLSKDLARCRGTAENVREMATRYVYVAYEGLHYIRPEGAHFVPILQNFGDLISTFCHGATSGATVVREYVTLIVRLTADDATVANTLGEAVSSLLPINAPDTTDGAAVQVVIESEGDLFNQLFTAPSEAEAARSLASHDRQMISHVLIRYAALVGSVRRDYLDKPSSRYALLPFRYHINLSGAFWAAMKNGAKLAPLLFALVRLELPHFAEIAAAVETIRILAENINRLSERAGEICVYSGIVFARSTLRSDPTSQDIEREIRSLPCVHSTCKFFRGPGEDCAISQADIDGILGFLKQKKIVKEVTAKEWSITL